MRNIPDALTGSPGKKGYGIVMVDLTGTGEAWSTMDKPGKRIIFPNMSRGELWLGKTILGEWVRELNIVVHFLNESLKATKISFDGTREAGLASLFLCAVENQVNIGNITLRDAPVSYLFDNKETIDFFSMGIHLPGFLNWGDVSLAAALTGKNIIFVNPVTMSGQPVTGVRLKEVQNEFQKIRSACSKPGNTIFN